MKRQKRGTHVCSPLFSNEDDDLSLLRWRLDKSGYARTTINRKESNRKIILTKKAHRIVVERMLCRALKSNEYVDHINGNRLDARRANLRIVTWQQNSQNRRAMNSTGIRGVTFHKARRKWQASVKYRDHMYYGGLHDTPEKAGEAAAAIRLKLGFAGGAA